MRKFQLIDCVSGRSRITDAEKIPPTLAEFLMPAVQEGSGMYQDFFYRLVTLDGCAGVMFHITWHSGEGEPLADGFVSAVRSPEAFEQWLALTHRPELFGPKPEKSDEPVPPFAAVLRYPQSRAAKNARSEEYPGWESRFETLLVALSDLLISEEEKRGARGR